jgi:hypothetical protein
MASLRATLRSVRLQGSAGDILTGDRTVKEHRKDHKVWRIVYGLAILSTIAVIIFLLLFSQHFSG